MEQKKDYSGIIEYSEENRNLLINDDKCDKYDYLVAVACGAIGGLIDVFLVGAPGESVLGNWTDKQVDNVVKSFARKMGWSPREKNRDNIASAIGFLRDKYKVNYDQASTKAVGGAFNMYTRDHHMKSLAHSPDIIGLFFSIINQFTETSSFIADGRIITIKSDSFELQGGNFISKLFCGISNWFGHLLSDIAGDNGSRGAGNRGMGIVMPFYELFGFCKFGKFSAGKDKQELAMIATRAFTQGYDARFGATMAIPVILTDLSIRLIWALRRHFGFGKPIVDCIPNDSHPDLRIMLLFGNGTLCVIDGIGAAAQSGGNIVGFILHLNIIAWFRLVFLIFKEICIRLKLSNQIQLQLEAYTRIDEALHKYLLELKQIDIEEYKKETEQYNLISKCISDVETPEELNIVLLDFYERYEIKKPWTGDFDDFMSDKSAFLDFT